MKTQTFAAILAGWVGARRLVDAADELGVGVSTLCCLMRGHNVPWDRQVRRMAAVLGWSPDKLSALCARERLVIKQRPRIATRKPRIDVRPKRKAVRA